MLKQGLRPGVVFLLLLFPLPVLAQGLNIDHKPVGCVVADKYPKLNACISPADQLARARVYFRVEEGAPNWFYVEMRSEAPCHAGILPKPKKELIGKKVLYYLDAFDQKFAENRTVDNEALVVRSESECKKDIPVAPFAGSAPAAVFPGMPAGFAAGGIGSATAVGAVVGGAAVVGGGIALATSGNNKPPSTMPPTTTVLATVPATVSTTTTTTQPPVPFNAVFIVRMAGVVQTGSPIVLKVATQIEFDMCQSTGPGQLTFSLGIDAISFFGGHEPGFPVTLGGPCSIPVTFGSSGISSPFIGSSGLGLGAAATLPFGRFDVRMRVETAGTIGNNPQGHQDVEIVMFGCPVCFESRPSSPSPPTEQIAWATRLEVPGATGQVVVNGSTAVFADPGRSTVLTVGRSSEYRVEAQLVQGAGKPGLWRFDLPTTSLVPGSLRILAGDVALASGESVVFRLSGRVGERVVFSFHTAS